VHRDGTATAPGGGWESLTFAGPARALPAEGRVLRVLLVQDLLVRRVPGCSEPSAIGGMGACAVRARGQETYGDAMLGCAASGGP